MKFLIALLLTCSSVLGQGFGSFTHDQPFLQSTSSGSVNPNCSLPGWDPTTISNLILDLDACRSGPYTSTPNTSGGELTNVIDFSAAATPMTVVANSGGKMRWWKTDNLYRTNAFFAWTNSGNCGFLPTTPVNLPAPFTYVWVVQITNSLVSSKLFFQGTIAGAYNRYFYAWDVARFLYDGGSFTANPSWVDKKWFVLSYRGENTSNTSSVRTNGVVLKTWTAAVPDTQIAVGLRAVDSTGNFPGNMARVLVWNRKLTDAEMLTVETNIISDYCIKTNAP